MLVTERDWRVLLWLAEQFACRLDQVQYLLGQEAGRGVKIEGQISESAARLVVARWERAGLAAHKKVFVREPSWVWSTAKALHEFGLSYKPNTPSLVSLNHIYAVNQVRMTVEREHPDDIWISERQIRADMVYQKGARLPHVPDGILQMKKGEVAIEVELTLTKPAVLQGLLRELLATYQWVWYIVTEETRGAVSAAQKKLDLSSADRAWLSIQSGGRATISFLAARFEVFALADHTIAWCNHDSSHCTHPPVSVTYSQQAKSEHLVADHRSQVFVTMKERKSLWPRSEVYQPTFLLTPTFLN